MIYDNLTFGFKKLLKTSTILFISTLVLALASCFAYKPILKLQQLAVNWPTELLSLCGTSFAFGINASLLVFYISIIILNIFAISCCAGLAVNIIKQDEKNGMIIHYINQPYSKIQLYIIKLTLSIFYLLLQWCVYLISLTLSIYIICTHFNLSFSNEIKHISNIGKHGIPILFLALALCLLYAYLGSERMGYTYFLMTTFSFSLLIGNLYKIFDLIAYYMRSGQIDDSTMMSISEILIKLRIFFPFTLINRLNIEKQPLPESSNFLYISISALLLALCGYIYVTKKIDTND